jgi:hypothetical protein
MNNGKSQSWFYVASRLEPLLRHHYIAKVDTDTIAFLDVLLEHIDHYFPNTNDYPLVYAGKFKHIRSSKNTNDAKTLGCAGELYFLSVQLANYITSDDDPNLLQTRQNTMGSMEDVSIWKMIDTYHDRNETTTVHNKNVVYHHMEKQELPKPQQRLWSHQPKWKDPDLYRQHYLETITAQTLS